MLSLRKVAPQEGSATIHAPRSRYVGPGCQKATQRVRKMKLSGAHMQTYVY